MDRHRPIAALALVLAAVLPACGRASAPARGGFLVVAAENFWGSIAEQLAGTRAQVGSVIENPGTDPHSYTPTAGDSRLLAQSRLAIVNGLGYDDWAGRALAANEDPHRVVLDVGRLVGLAGGANPHQWYAPASVRRVVDAIAAGLIRVDPADRAYFAGRRQRLLTVGLAGYDRLRAEIRRRFRGVAVGYSESIFEPLGRDLGLDLASPADFAKAIAEGAEVSARDLQTVDRQAATGEIKVWVYNRQNLTPEVGRVNAIAAAHGVPTVSVTETLAPVGASFEQWQVGQLRALVAALHRATGR